MRSSFFYGVMLFCCVHLALAADISSLKKEIDEINEKIEISHNIWLKYYMSSQSYNDLLDEINTLKQEIQTQPNPSRSLYRRLETLQRQQNLLKDHARESYKGLLEVKNIEDVPEITNPFLIINGYSFIKFIKEQEDIFVANQESLQNLLDMLREKYTLLLELSFIDKSVEVANDIVATQRIIEELEGTKKVLETSMDIYAQEAQNVRVKLINQIKNQVVKIVYVCIGIIITIFLAFLFKLTLRKYILDTDRIYTASKVVNFLNITIIVLILLFSYMENVTYLVAIVGFASAGLAIAMKDLFMSILGWFVIVLGGSVHVGDRVRVCKDNSIYVGDVLDISMLRITLFEDVTLTSYMENRRAGRIIFVPNNYIFTTMFANYTHGGIKTVWDGIDFTITFDSNYNKALKIATDIGKKYAKGYTEMVRRQVHRMRDKYSLRNPNLEVRSYCFIEPNGLRISLWYQTNAYATLALRSTISGEIIDQILKEDDIHIAYPTSKVVTGRDGLGGDVQKLDSKTLLGAGSIDINKDMI